MKKSKLFGRLCALLAAAVLAGSSAVMYTSAENEKKIDPTGKGDGYSAVLYDNTCGLPTSEVNDVAQTEEGFIWVGSYSGLIRYDGNTFERIDSTSGIASVTCLHVDSRNRLWIGTNDSGIAVMDSGGIVKSFSKSDGLRSASVREICEDASGRIYAATTHGLAVIDSELSLSIVDEPQIRDEFIREIAAGADNTMYGLTMDNAVFMMKDGKLTGFYNDLGIPEIRVICPDKEKAGYIYCAGTNQATVYYGDLTAGFKDPKKIDSAPFEYINSIEEADGRIWVCSDNGIGFIENGKVTVFSHLPMNNSVENMMSDYQGNLWFTSSRQGIMKIVPNRFTDIFQSNDLEASVVNSTCKYKDMLFIGSGNSGLTVIGANGKLDSLPLSKAVTDGGKELPYTDLIAMLEGSKIRSVIRDSKNRIWISSFGDLPLIRYDNGEALVFTADTLPSNRARTVFEKSDGTLMAVCTGGLVIIDGDKVTKIYNEESGISNLELLTVTEAANGDIIAGSDGDGLYVISGSKVTHYGTESGLMSDVVMRIKKDPLKDIYWIVTSNSIAYMDSSYNITTVKNFPYSNNFDLYENSKGEMWILSSNGIYVTPAEELIKNGDISPLFYGRDNGLPCIASANSYSELTEEGDLYIAGTTGVAKVNIEEQFGHISELRAAVPYIEADGTTLLPDSSGSFTVPSDVKKVTIHSFVYNYSLINPQVTYSLEGFDDRQTTVKRSELVPIDYTNLSGGTYKFKMQIADPQGSDSKELTVVITKEKAFHEMLWFRILAAVLGVFLILLAVMLYFRRRIKAYKKKEEEDRTFMREMIEAFAKIIDMKDKYTNGHSTRVAEYTVMLARELGYDEETLERYHNIALLHDIGKIGVPPEVLNKPGKLTDREFAIIKSHSALGFNALKDISIMPELAIGAGAHHERPDGKGYPKGLKGDEIPRVAQIIAVADTFDAMYSDRPYRKRMNFDKAVSIVKEVSGTQLAADVVDAFLRLVEKGEFRDPSDDGGGTTEDIDNIRKKYELKEKQKKQDQEMGSEHKE